MGLPSDRTDQKSSATFTVDQDKINADGEQAEKSVQEFDDETKEAVGGSTEKDASEEVRGDANQPVSTATELQ